MFCYCHLRAIYIRASTQQEHICSFPLFAHTHPHFDGQLKSQLSSHQPLVWQLCPPLWWARIIEANRYGGQDIAKFTERLEGKKKYILTQLGIMVLLLLHLCIWKMHRCILSVLAIKIHDLGNTMLAELCELLNDNRAQKRLGVFLYQGHASIR